MLICQEPELADLDQQLGTLYREQIGKIPKERQDEFQRHEALFLSARRRCRDNYRCIEQSYRNRIKELEDFLSEARREEAAGDASSSEAEPDQPTGSPDRQTIHSERAREPSGSSNPAIPEPLSTEAPRAATAIPHHHSKNRRATAAAASAASQPQETASGETTGHVGADRSAPTDDVPAKPDIRWVDPPPRR